MRIPSRKVWLKPVVGALCALVLLAHAALVLHKAAAPHPAGDACEYCLAANNLTGTASVSLPVIPHAVVDAPPVPTDSPLTAFSLRVYDGRAPPVVS